MSCTDIERMLDDHVDGALEDSDRAAVERHLADCATCRACLEELEGLLSRARELGDDVAPRRDLYPGVRRAIADPAAQPWWTSPRAWAGLAAAGLLVALVVWPLFERRGAGGGTRPVGEATSLALLPAAQTDDFKAAEAEFERAAEQLLSTLEDNEARLPAETREIVRGNLQQIDRAISEIREALTAEPDNPAHLEVLTTLHRQKLNFLWTVHDLAS